MDTDFDESSVAHSLKSLQFSDITADTRAQLVRLIINISEASYRRGYQHGALLGKDETEESLYSFRYETPLFISPMRHGGQLLSGAERLFMEYPVLTELGFDEPITMRF